MTPGLIMNSILTSQLSTGEAGKIVGFLLALTLVMISMTLFLGRSLGWRETERNAAVLSSSFMNAANYGLPVVLLAFGQAGFDRAAILVGGRVDPDVYGGGLLRCSRPHDLAFCGDLGRPCRRP